jgi:biotin carboxyl carrier protein
MKDDNQELVNFQVLSIKYKTRLTKKYKERKKYEAPNSLEIRSVIPGTILDIKVKEGQKVKEGEVLLLHEAMKMVNEIQMPFNGTVKKVFVEKGQRIAKDVIMIELK